MSKVGLELLGSASMGSNHAMSCVRGQVLDAELTVCDIDPRRLEGGSKPGAEVQRFASADQLFASGCVDAVLIATPYDHPPLALPPLSRDCMY